MRTLICKVLLFLKNNFRMPLTVMLSYQEAEYKTVISRGVPACSLRALTYGLYRPVGH